MEQQVVYIEVAIGKLPEWYDEVEHDYELERAIEKQWHSSPAYQDAEVDVTYRYNGVHTVRGFDEDGNKVIDRECDLDEIFAKLAPEEE